MITRHKLFIGILLLSLILRAPLIWTSQSHIDSDAAEIGMMAKHILERGEHTIFAWKQPYTGGYSFEAHLAAAIFYFFGVSVYSLKMVGLVLSLTLLTISYIFTYAFFGMRLAVVSSLLLSLATPLLRWNLQMRGGYLESMIFTVLIFSIMFKIFFGERTMAKWRHYALWGFLSGLAWWNSEIILSFLVTSIFIWFIHDRRFFVKVSFPIWVFFFLIGNTLTIYYNLTHDFQNVKYVFGFLLMKGNTPFEISGLYAYFLVKLRFISEVFLFTLPRFFETDNEWSYFRRISISSWFQYLILLSAMCHAICNIRGNKALLNKKSSMLFFVLAHLAAYCFANPYGPQVQRFFLLLYPYISIFTADLILSLNARRRFMRILGASAFVFIVLTGEISYIDSLAEESEWKDPDPTGPYIQTKGETIPRIISFLESQGIVYVHTTHYIKYRLIFESQERIIASSEFFHPERNFYPLYENMVREAGPKPTAVVLYRESKFVGFLQRFIKEKGISYKRKQIGEMVVFYPFAGDRLIHYFLQQRKRGQRFQVLGD